MRHSHTAVIELNRELRGEFAVEPYETAWASEAIYFIRTLTATGVPEDLRAVVQISPDGIHWCDEGTDISVPHSPGLSFARVSHFGGWLRLVGNLPDSASATVIVYLVLKE